ncbi:MAG: enoyl-CoA hydratase/isomerase family protein [Rhodobacteraceae bacterium]|nr:enoyl-CoA hydratase/isomerase family protein [Paracoccaceae bacterium]
MAELIRTDHAGGIARLTLARAPVNALVPDFLMDFAVSIDRLAADDAVRAIVIDSAFGVHSAGLDLKAAQTWDRGGEHAIVAALNIGFTTLFACPKPTVAAIAGPAIAGGLFFVLGCDYRVAAPRASFGLAEVRVGADFPVGPMEIARATLSANDLRRLMLTGQPVSADRALASGIVDELVDEAMLGEAALQAAAALADNPPLTYAAVKRQIRGEVIARIKAAMAAGGNAPPDGWFNSETKAAMARMIAGRG